MNENDTFAFLQSLFGDSDKGFLSVWAKDTDSRFFRANDLVAASEFIRKVGETIDVYVGVGIRQCDLGAKKRGGVSDVCRMSCVWLDLDLRDDVHATHKDLPRNLDEGFALIDHLPEPSMIIHSGHGLHIYWLLEKPIEISDAASLQKAQMLIRGVQEAVIDRGKSNGLHVDSTFDLARVLRPPGTFNYKSKPTAVWLLKDDYQLRYKSDDLFPMSRDIDFGGLHKKSGAPNLVKVLSDISALPSRVEQLICKGMNGNSQYPSRSEAVAAVEHALIDSGRSDAEIKEVLLSPANAISELPREKGAKWIADDIRRAREKHSARRPLIGAETSVPMRFLNREQLSKIEPPEWLVDGLLPLGGIAVLYGPSGCGKSFVALDWAASVATGHSWFGSEVKAGLVLYVAAEGISGVPLRVRAWEQVRLADDQMIDQLYVGIEPVNLLEPKSVKRLVSGIEALPIIPSMIILDTLARCMVGGDENSARDMGKAIASADSIREFTGATILLVHHTAKERNVERGSSALRGAADTMISLTEDGAELSVDKQKEADARDSITLARRIVNLGDGLSSCVIEQSDFRPLSFLDSTDISLIEHLVYKFDHHGARFTELKDSWISETNGKEATFKRHLKKLKEGKYLNQDNRYYTVTDAVKLSLGYVDAVVIEETS